jgi:hypothetical protein
VRYDIDTMTDEQLDEFLAQEELKCKIDPKTGDVKCATSEDLARAIARLKNQPKKIIFEVTTQTVEEPKES